MMMCCISSPEPVNTMRPVLEKNNIYPVIWAIKEE